MINCFFIKDKETAEGNALWGESREYFQRKTLSHSQVHFKCCKMNMFQKGPFQIASLNYIHSTFVLDFEFQVVWKNFLLSPPLPPVWNHWKLILSTGPDLLIATFVAWTRRNTRKTAAAAGSFHHTLAKVPSWLSMSSIASPRGQCQHGMGLWCRVIPTHSAAI